MCQGRWEQDLLEHGLSSAAAAVGSGAGVQPGSSAGQPWQSALGAQGSHAQPARLSSPGPLVFDRWSDLWLLLL